MKIEKNTVATVNYALKNDAGETIDSSEEAGPIMLLAGAGEMIPGLEKALEGREKGDKFNVTIQPEDAYGERNDQMIERVPRANFPGIEDIEAGMMFQTMDNAEQPMVVRVLEVDDEFVTVDGNHPMAGAVLNFDLEVVDVRAATEEEIANGHVHSPGHA